MSCALLGISLLDQFAHIFLSLVFILLFLSQFLIHFFLRISNVEPMAYLKILFIIGMRATYHTVILSCLLSTPTSY